MKILLKHTVTGELAYFETSSAPQYAFANAFEIAKELGIKIYVSPASKLAKVTGLTYRYGGDLISENLLKLETEFLAKQHNYEYKVGVITRMYSKKRDWSGYTAINPWTSIRKGYAESFDHPLIVLYKTDDQYKADDQLMMILSLLSAEQYGIHCYRCTHLSKAIRSSVVSHLIGSDEKAVKALGLMDYVPVNPNDEWADTFMWLKSQLRYTV